MTVIRNYAATVWRCLNILMNWFLQGTERDGKSYNLKLLEEVRSYSYKDPFTGVKMSFDGILLVFTSVDQTCAIFSIHTESVVHRA